ncbi:MAG: sigma-70 family RNA polymerase sigma factor [bacterium]|nr:sigma-70 family RNA polymerase sigma factor [bacterium]
MPETTQLLAQVRAGAPEAREELLGLVYEELRRIARGQLRRRNGASLVTTELVHEAFLKLYAGPGADAKDRAHFLALAATAMRQVLIDHFRARQAEKRGGGVEVATLETFHGASLEDRGSMVVALHEALERLEGFDPRLARIVECRFFGGMTEDEIAEALSVSKRTVSREWRQAKAWLARELEP